MMTTPLRERIVAGVAALYLQCLTTATYTTVMREVELRESQPYTCNVDYCNWTLVVLHSDVGAPQPYTCNVDYCNPGCHGFLMR